MSGEESYGEKKLGEVLRRVEKLEHGKVERDELLLVVVVLCIVLGVALYVVLGEISELRHLLGLE